MFIYIWLHIKFYFFQNMFDFSTYKFFFKLVMSK